MAAVMVHFSLKNMFSSFPTPAPIPRFMGSLTALLVLASMMPVFTGDLPKAAYTKVSTQEIKVAPTFHVFS